MNPMRNIQIEKITVNIGCGDSGDKLEKAKKLLVYSGEKKRTDRISCGRIISIV